MEYYMKVNEAMVPSSPPFPFEFVNDVTIMSVKENTKIKNILHFVEKLFQDGNCRKVIFKGVGEATLKCISCVEVFKRNYQGEMLYQWNKIIFTRRTDIWKSTEENLRDILVHVDYPTIYILISKDPFPDDVNKSCQISSGGVEVLTLPDSQMSDTKKHELPSKKPSLHRPSEPNKWCRPPKKCGKLQRRHMLKSNADA